MTEERASPAGLESNRAPLWKRALPIIGALAIVVFIFGWVLPQFIDYDAAFRAIDEINAVEWTVLLIVASLRFVPEGWVFVSAQPGLNTKQGTSLFLVANALANVPPGGLDLVSRYQMTRSWGFPASSATAGTVASWIFSTFGKLVLPVIAVLVLAVRRIGNDELDAPCADRPPCRRCRSGGVVPRSWVAGTGRSGRKGPGPFRALGDGVIPQRGDYGLQ